MQGRHCIGGKVQSWIPVPAGLDCEKLVSITRTVLNFDETPRVDEDGILLAPRQKAWVEEREYNGQVAKCLVVSAKVDNQSLAVAMERLFADKLLYLLDVLKVAKRLLPEDKLADIPVDAAADASVDVPADASVNAEPRRRGRRKV